MLTAFKDELKRLAVDPDDQFHKRIRERVGKRATQILEQRLKLLILIMPGLVKRIHAHWAESAAGSETKKLGGFVFAYLYHPKDFLPEDTYGLFGYLDDAYLVLIIYEKVIREASKAGGFVHESDRDYLKKIHESKRYVTAVIPQETKRIEEMVQKAIKNGEFNDFAEALRSAG